MMTSPDIDCVGDFGCLNNVSIDLLHYKLRQCINFQTIFQTTKQLLMTSLVSASCILINLLLRCYISITVVHLQITSTLNFRQTVKCKATRIRELTASRVPCKVVLSYHADACVEFYKRSFNIELNLKGDIIVVSTMASQQRPLKPVYCFTKY